MRETHGLISILAAIFIFTFAQPLRASEHCAFYVELSEELTCTEGKDYADNYGLKYCRRFNSDALPNLSTYKKFVSKATRCLKSKLSESYIRKNCEQLKNVAFESHAGCYYESGFCAMEPEHQNRIIDAVDVDDIIKNLELSAAQALLIAKRCNIKWMSKIGVLLSLLLQSLETEPSNANLIKEILKQILSGTSDRRLIGIEDAVRVLSGNEFAITAEASNTAMLRFQTAIETCRNQSKSYEEREKCEKMTEYSSYLPDSRTVQRDRLSIALKRLKSRK